MAQENIDFGNYPNDANADAIRSAFQKAQNNFTELYGVTLATGVTSVTAGPGLKQDNTSGNIILTANIPNITIQTDNNLLVGISTATGNSATITSGNTPFAFKLANTVTVANLVATNLTGTLITAAQPNITSVGVLNNLTVQGNVVAGNFIGNFIGTTTSSQITAPGSDTQLLFNNQGTVNAISNVTFSGSALSVVGNVSVTSNVTASQFIGKGNTLSNIQAANITGTVANANYATHAGTLLTAVQPNITSVGTLTSLTVNGNVLPNADVTYNLGSSTRAWKDLWISGGTINMKTSGGTASITATNTSVAITNPVGGGITITDNKIFDGTNISSGNSNVQVYANSNVAVSVSGTSNVVVISNNAVTVAGNVNADNAALGNTVTANYFVGDGSLLTNLPTTGGGSGGSSDTANYANFAGNVTRASQPNITSVGTLVSLAVTGNITSGNANLGNLARANFFIGSGNNLSNIQAANITGTVANATYATSADFASTATTAGTVTTASQPNITSVGTLTGLTVSGIITSTNANLGNAARANYFIGNGVYISNIAGASVSGLVANANYAAYAGNVLGSIDNANYAAYAGNITVAAQPNITSVGILSNLIISGNLTVSGKTTLGDSSNVKITGGTNGQVLKTDGAGNLSWVTQSGGGSGTPGGANTQLQFNDSGTFGGDSGLTYNKTNGTLTAASLAGTLTTAAQPNITSIGRLTALTVGTASSNTTFNNGTINTAGSITAVGNIDAGSNYIKGNGAFLTGITTTAVSNSIVNGTSNIIIPTTGSNISMTVAGTANVLVVNNTGIIVAGNINSSNANLGNNASANFFTGNGYFLTNINGSNVSNVANANLANYSGVVTANAQPNITSVGRLNALIVGNAISNTSFGNGTITANGNISAGTTVGANYIFGNGYYLSGLSSMSSISNGTSNVSIPIANTGVLISVGGTSNVFVVNATGANITGTANIAGNLSAVNANLGNLLEANYFKGSGNLLSNIQGANVIGNVANANFANVSYRSNIVQVTTGTYYPQLINSVAGNLSGYANANLSYNIDTNTFFAKYLTGTFTAAASAQPNITSFGTLTSLSVQGNIDATGTTHVTAGYFIGQGNNLSNIQGANVVGEVSNALVAGTVYTAAQPNITSVGTLKSLTVANIGSTGNITADNANLGNLVKSNFFSGNANLLSNIPGANVVGTVANANYAAYSGNTYSVTGSNVSGMVANANYAAYSGNSFSVTGSNVVGTVANATYATSAGSATTATSATTAGTVTTAAQPNITSVGTLTNLTVSALTNLGNVSNITITGGSAGTVLTSNGAGGLSFTAVPSGSIVQVRTAFAGPDMQTVPDWGYPMAITNLMIPFTPKSATSKIWIKPSIISGASFPHGFAIYKSDRFIPLTSVVVSGALNTVIAFNAGNPGATGTVTITTSSAHGLSVNNFVYLDNVNSGSNPSKANGSYMVKTVPSTTTFTADWYPRLYGDILTNGAQTLTGTSRLYTVIPTVTTSYSAGASSVPNNRCYPNLNITLWPESTGVSGSSTFDYFEIAANTSIRYYHLYGVAKWTGTNYNLWFNNRSGTDMASYSSMVAQEIAA